MSEFFLHETQAQLQLGMFGFSNEFQEKTNKKIRDAFAGVDVGYTDQFSIEALHETQSSKGPLSKLFDLSEDELKNKGNMLIFAFAGHDTTGHTLTWLLYELCKTPEFKQELINTADKDEGINGDKVSIIECRPYSKTKKFEVIGDVK